MRRRLVGGAGRARRRNERRKIYADGGAAIEAARAHRVDAAVLDLEMPGLDGMTVAEELAKALPSCAPWSS